MTKKDFEAFATEFGLAMQIRPTEAEYGLWVAVDVFCAVAHRQNPRFDADRFKDWVTDVRDGVRDVNGKKVKQKGWCGT